VSHKLRLAAVLGTLSLLAACGPLPADSVPAKPVAPVVSTVASPSDTATSSPTPAAPDTFPVVPATTAPPVSTHTNAAPPPQPAACAADEYRNVDGVCVHRPEQANQPPAGATAQCNDGSYSFSQHRQGTCSHHGGVRRWL
jgi:hypothetical protein